MTSDVSVSWDTDQDVIKRLDDLGERTTTIKNTLFNGIDALGGGGMIGAAGGAAQRFKQTITDHITNINNIGDDVAAVLQAATTSTTQDDQDAQQALDATLGDIDPAATQLGKGPG